MTSGSLVRRGGAGRPLVLVHGLMGRGSTWSRQLPWLTRLGEVFTYDAPWHRGRDVDDPRTIGTETSVDDPSAALESLGRSAVPIGHSMGGLHSWCVAAERPDLVAALVVEDMAPDFVGGTTGPWELWLHRVAVEFGSAEDVFAEFGPIAASTSLTRSTAPPPVGDCTVGRSGGSRLPRNGERAIIGRSGRPAGPALLIEAGRSVAPEGQMRKMSEIAATGPPISRFPNQGIWFTTRLRNVIAARSSSSSLPSLPFLSRARLSREQTLRSPDTQ